MDDDVEAMRQRAAEQLDELDQMLAQRRQERAQRPQWQPPAAEPPKPVQRAPEPRERPSPAPPVPTEVTHPRHGSDGRIVEIAKYSGDAASAARSWENFTRSVVRLEFNRLEDQIVALAAEIGRDMTEMQREIDRLRQQLQGHEQPLAEAAD